MNTIIRVSEESLKIVRWSAIDTSIRLHQPELIRGWFDAAQSRHTVRSVWMWTSGMWIPLNLGFHDPSCVFGDDVSDGRNDGKAQPKNLVRCHSKEENEQVSHNSLSLLNTHPQHVFQTDCIISSEQHQKPFVIRTE